MTRDARERLVRTRDDPDLGRLELWTWPLPRGWRRLWMSEWRGVTGHLPLTISIDADVDPDAQLAFLDAEVRAVIAALGARERDLRAETARREIGLARDWRRDDALSEQAFADTLRAERVDVYTDADDTLIELVFDDTARIFAGHVVSAVLDRTGAIVSTGIEG